MRPGTRRLIKIALLVTIVASNAACTTTTKKLTTTKPRVDSTSQLTKARQAFNQKNYEQAASLLTPLAEQGDANAQYALGYMYHNGLGVPRNYKLAIQWMTAASAKGNEKATEALRRISELGSDVTDNNLQEMQAEPATETESMEPIMISGKKPEITKTPAPESTADAVSTLTPVKTGPKPEPEIPSQAEPEKIETPATTPGPASETPLTTDEQWIMDQPNTHYTMQLIATGNESALIRFVNENNLQNNAKYYRTLRNNKDWYTLIQGSYDSSTAARKAIKELDTGLQDMNPWVKSIADIQKALSNR